MGVKCASLKVGDLYYTVGIVADPVMELCESTWVYLRNEGERYYFAEWNTYFWEKFKSEGKSIAIDFGTTLDKATGELTSLVPKQDLMAEIENIMSEYGDDYGDELPKGEESN